MKKGLITLTLVCGISGAFLKIDFRFTWGDPKSNIGKKQIWRFGLGVFSTAVNHFENEQFENALFETTTLNCAQFDIDTFDDLTFLRRKLFAIFSLLKCADWESTILRHAHFATVPFLRHFTSSLNLIYLTVFAGEIEDFQT